MSVPERLVRIRGEDSQREVARKLGIAVNTWRRYESGERAPDFGVLSGIAGLGWNPTWVLTGEGDERLADHVDREAAGIFAGAVAGDPEAAQQWERHRKSAAAGRRGAVDALKGRPVDFDDYTFVPHLSVRAAAGAGQVVESEQIVAWMAFRKSYLQMLGVPARAACLIRVRGDSMEPDLREGDTVLVDTSDVVVRDRPRIYVMRYVDNNDLVVKRVCRLQSGAWHINGGTHWPETQIPADVDKPLVIGRVRWSGRTWD